MDYLHRTEFIHREELSSFPTRTCWKMTGPPGILILIKIAMISRIGHKQINPKNDAVRSKIHFASIVMTIIEKFYTRFFTQAGAMSRQNMA